MLIIENEYYEGMLCHKKFTAYLFEKNEFLKSENRIVRSI